MSSIEGRWLGEKWCFGEANLSAFQARYGDMRLVHRALFVGEYLSQLREEGLDPLFKGGSALMFLVPELRRLSEDLDLALDDAEALGRALAGVKRRLPGFAYEADRRRGGGIHYSLTLPSPAEGYITLDAVEGNPGYATRTIRLRSALYESEARVRVPTTNALFGDKLTTQGRRIGLQLFKRPAREHAKQLYDLSVLLDNYTDFDEVRDAFSRTVAFQCAYRKVKCTVADAVADFVDAMRMFVLTPQNVPVPERLRVRVEEFRYGLKHLENILEKGNRFGPSRARREAARLMFFAGLLGRAEEEQPVAKDIQEAFARAAPAMRDESLMDRAAQVVKVKEPLLFSKDLLNGAPDALLFIASSHEPGLLMP